VDLPPIKLIQTPQAWTECLAELRQQPQLALDTESNSLFAYREQVCLIQVSIPGRDFLVDPLSLTHLDGLGDLLADPAVEKVFHAAEYDLLLLKQDFAYTFANLFDTMLAARILGWKKLGLAPILKQEFDVDVDKRFQRANWGRRPLTPEMIRYARLDTHFLLPLRQRLAEQLADTQRVAEARQSFERIAQVVPSPRHFDPEEFWHLLNGHHRVTPMQAAVLRELYVYREREAQRRNFPPFKVMSDRTLVELAEAAPQFVDECQGIHGLTRGVMARYGRQLLRVVQNGMRGEPPTPRPCQQKPAPSVLARYEALHTWRKQQAVERGVESDIILSREALWDLAHQNPKSVADLVSLKSLNDWQRDEHGAALLLALAQVRKTG